MTETKSRGSRVLEVLIALLILALFATVLYPKKIWEREDKNTKICRAQMNQIFKAEAIFSKYYHNYTTSLDRLMLMFKADSIKTEVVREYVYADTALAEQLIKFLTQSDTKAEEIVKTLIADTLRFAILEAINYDSNLAHVMLNHLEKTTMADQIKRKRASGNNDVVLLTETYHEYPGIDVYELLKTNDSLLHVFDRIMPDLPAAFLVDTLYGLNSSWAHQVDSAVLATIENFRTCPTSNREYKIAVIDTSISKAIIIECPIDSIDLRNAKRNFMEYRLGHLRLKNHGKIENGETSWIH